MISQTVPSGSGMLPAHAVNVLDHAGEPDPGGEHRRTGGIEVADGEADDRARREERAELIARTVDLEHLCHRRDGTRQIRSLLCDRHAEDVPEQRDRLGEPVTAHPHEGHRMHACGCVTDWGWDAAHADPFAFINWCATIIDNPCPWHAGGPAQPDDLIMAGHPDGGVAFYARQATGDDIVLGRNLTSELTRISQLVANGDVETILGDIPPAYRDWMNSNGYDPADTWIQQRMTDLILNRGQSMLPGFDGPVS
jgi:hypothetical protein